MNDYKETLAKLKEESAGTVPSLAEAITDTAQNAVQAEKEEGGAFVKKVRNTMNSSAAELYDAIAEFNRDVLLIYERPVVVANEDSLDVLVAKAKLALQEAKTIIGAETVELHSSFVESKEVEEELKSVKRKNQYLQGELENSNARKEQDESVLKQRLEEAEKEINNLKGELNYEIGESRHTKNSWIRQRNTLLGLSGALFVLFITVLLLFASSANDKLTGTKSQNNGISVDAGTISTNLPFNVSWSEEQSNYIARVTAETVPTESVMDEKLMAALASADTQFSLYLLNANLDNADDEAALNLFDQYFDPNDALGDPTILPNHWIQDANGGLALKEPVIILLLPSENGTPPIGDEAVNYCKSGHTVCYSSSRGLFIAELYSTK